MKPRCRSAGYLLLHLLIVGCASGAKLIDNPEPLAIVQPLTTTVDEQFEVQLDWVIVRGGPGTWVTNADWDEYIFRIRNLTDSNLRIMNVAVYDSLNTRLETTGRRPHLVQASKQTSKRYKVEGLKVRAGMRGGTLMAAGDAVSAVGFGALFEGATWTSGAAGPAIGAMAVGPLIIISGAVRSMNNAEVEAELIQRQTNLPVVLAPQEERRMHFFFPLAPSPKKWRSITEIRPAKSSLLSIPVPFSTVFTSVTTARRNAILQQRDRSATNDYFALSVCVARWLRDRVGVRRPLIPTGSPSGIR